MWQCNAQKGTRRAAFLSVQPVDIMFIKFYFTFKEKIVPGNYVSLTCQLLRDALTDRVPIILTDPVP